MIVTCSKCEKRYVVDPRALGSPGRRVRCANCQHTWFETAPEEAQSSIELPPLPETPPVVRTTTTVDPGPAARRVQLPAVARQGRGMVWLRRGVIAAAVVIVIWALIAERQHVMSASGGSRGQRVPVALDGAIVCRGSVAAHTRGWLGMSCEEH